MRFLINLLKYFYDWIVPFIMKTPEVKKEINVMNARLQYFENNPPIKNENYIDYYNLPIRSVSTNLDIATEKRNNLIKIKQEEIAKGWLS